ncbi:iron chelate uptake ABC transporter family permease subunit [Staphylococcus aureus]|nr:iron chelate uptake ABC transporter family permease subunit [Staphylococcus aureus]
MHEVIGVRFEQRTINIILYRSDVIICCCSVAGSISFIGLMGPHIAKRIVGPRHQLFLPIAILVGACLLVIADTIGKIVLQPGGVPAGIVVAIIGSPYFLYLMYKTKNV